MEEETSSTDLEEINTDDERATDISEWSDKECKKLHHMTEFQSGIAESFWREGITVYYYKKKNFSYEPPYTNISM